MRSATKATRALVEGFDFTLHMRRLCEDVCQRLAELNHIDMSRVAISYRQTRKAVSHGLQASLTPLRFEGGALYTVRHGRRMTVQRLFAPSGEEMLYILSFYLPRFLNHPFREKLITLFHELWHISGEFDGDLRRHPGRCYVHSHSQQEYDALSERLANRWLALAPPPGLYEFLQHDFAQLSRRHGAIFGMNIPRRRSSSLSEPS